MATQQRIEVIDYGGLDHLDLLLKEVDKLVSLPDVYYRLEALIENDGSSVNDFSSVLSSDPDLCARLLRLANSAFYSFPASIETVEKAIQVIGIRQIRELVLATSVIKAFNQMPVTMVNMKLFWEHSVAVGVLAKSIGQYCNISQPERFYVAGLLHDIGSLVFYLKLPGLMHDLMVERKEREQCMYMLEKENLGYHHAEVGGRLLNNWRVPSSIHEPVSCHHDPEQSHEFNLVTSAVHVADAWVNKHQFGSDGCQFNLKLNDYALQQLNLQSYELDEIWLTAEEALKDVMKQFLAQ